MKSGIRSEIRRVFLSSAALALLLFVSAPVFASQNQAVRNKLYENNGRKDICTAVQATIGQGIGADAVVRTAIQLGNSPCLVVKCAIYGGGNLKKIIAGAMQAGAPSDVVSKCAIDAGAESAEVGAFLLQSNVSLCYFEPGGLPYTPAEGTSVSFDSFPKSNPNPPISPATF